MIQSIYKFIRNDFQNGLFDLKMKLFLLFAPVVILFLTDRVEEKAGTIFKAFILENIAALAIYLFCALDHSFITNDSNQLVFEKNHQYINGVSEDLFEKGLCLPSGSNLTDDDFNRVIDAINQCFKRK